MSFIDIIIIVALLLFVANGLKDGFIHTFGNLIGMLIGLVASAFAIAWLQQNFDIFANQWVALLIYLSLSLLISRIFGWLVSLVDEAYNVLSVIPFLKPINKVLGAAAGFIEALIVLGAFSVIIQLFIVEGKLHEAIASSWILSTIGPLMNFAVKISLKLLGAIFPDALII